MSVALSFRLAWRSFLRHKRRSIITGAAISLSLALVLFFVGFSRDSHERLAEQAIRMGSGHVLVQGRGYRAEPGLEHLVTHPDAVERVARKLPGVRYVAFRLHAQALLSAGEHSAAVSVVGVDPQRESLASDLPKKKIFGSYLRGRADMPQKGVPPDIYLGVKLAKKLELELGDRVVLTVAPRGSGKTQASAFAVRGIFRSGTSELDSFYAEVPLLQLQKLLGVFGGVTQVALLLESQEQARAVAQRLGQRLEGLRRSGDLEVLPWQVALRELYDGLVLDKGSMYVMLAIIFLLVTIGIFNTMLMSVVERTREFGVMMAIGTSRGRLFSIVLAEAMVLALVAGAIGLGLGYGLHLWMASTGIDMAKFSGGAEFGGVAMTGMVYSRLTVEAMAGWTSTTCLLVLLSALYPAYRATRLQPVEAMRHV